MIYSEHHFQEVLKLLVIIASDAELQLKAHGIGNAEEEMSMDLDFHYSENRQSLLDSAQLTQSQAEAIDVVLQFFTEREQNQDDPFWYELESHEDWVTLRTLAQQALKKLNKENLKIEITITENTSWFSKNVTSQQIEINLVEK